MQISNSKVEGLKRTYTIKIESNQIVERNKKRLEELQKQAQFQGFRPGKVPLDYIVKKYKDAVTNETLEFLVRESSTKLIKDENLRIANQPDVKPQEYKDDKDFEYEFSCEVFPEVEEIDFSKIKLTNYIVKITDDNVNDRIDNLLMEGRNFVKSDDAKYKAKNGDAVKIDYVGSVDGKEFEGGKADDFQLELGSKTFIDGFEDGLVGVKAGDKKDVKVKFPDQYQSKDLQGKNAVFKVNVKEVLTAQNNKLDEEFAKKHNAKTVAEFKENIKNQVTHLYEQKSHDEFKKEFFDYLEKKVNLELPESLVNGEYESLLNQFYSEKGFKGKQDAEVRGAKEFKKIQKEYKQLSERRVKVGIILSELGSKNKISVSDDEVMNNLKSKFDSYPGNVEHLMQYYRQNPQALEHVRGALLEDKVVSFIKGKVVLKDKEMSVVQFDKIYEA